MQDARTLRGRHAADHWNRSGRSRTRHPDARSMNPKRERSVSRAGWERWKYVGRCCGRWWTVDRSMKHWFRGSTENLRPAGWKFSTRTGGHELDKRAIGVWKYVRTGINAYLKNQFENHSKIGNSVNNQKSKISKSNFSKARKEKRDNKKYTSKILLATERF